MAKTNFTKVEDALTEGLHKMKVEHLLELADLAAGTGIAKETTNEQLIATLKHDVSWLPKKDRKIFEKAEIKKKELEKLLEKPEDLKDEDWKKLRQIKDKFDAEKEKIRAKSSDEDLVDKERKRHIKKRFNVSERWLPLD